MAPFPSLTKTWHTQSYDAIDPLRPEVSARGKVVCITGGGGAIGGAITLAFAKAGASRIAIIGRREKPLEETKALVEEAVPGSEVLIVKGDISDEGSIRGSLEQVKSELGEIDVLVSNAGYLSQFAALEDANVDDWWKGFEVNVKGAFNVTRSFLPVAAKDAILVDISSCVTHILATPKASSYVASKLAATKVIESFGIEHPEISVVHVHPGVVQSDISAKAGFSSHDDADLSASFVVWAVSPEAKFLRGKFLWSNWDVDELKARKTELEQPNALTITLNGWPFGKDSESN